MREEIFLENLLKILNRGSWTMTGEEMKVFSHIHSQIEKRYIDSKKPPVVITPAQEPIKKAKKK